MEYTPEERRAAFEKRWQLAVCCTPRPSPTRLTDMAANDEARKFYEEKIRAVIDDPAVADLLIPNDHPIGTKRICTDSNYFQTFNRPNVTLVSVRATPIESVDATGINTTDAHYDLDTIVFATGFDAMTGALAKIDIVGRDGATLRDDWAHGPRTYLGLGVDGFPNLFLISRSGSARGAGQHGAARRGARELDRRLPSAISTTTATPQWKPPPTPWTAGCAECARRADASLFIKANSWYLGANVLASRGFSCCSSAGSRPTTTSAPRSPTPATRDSRC